MPVGLKDEIKTSLIANMQDLLDPYMGEQGFKRRAKSLVYKREYKLATQVIDMHLQIHPKDNPNASAAIYPFMEVHVPAVDRVLGKLVEGNPGLLEGTTNGRSSQPIGFTSQKADPGRWYVYQQDSVPEIVVSVRAFIERWVVPFLDVYATPEDIVATDERGDGRMVLDRAHIMRVVAAALVCNRQDHAQAVMEKRLSALGARLRYRQVYDYISGFQPSPEAKPDDGACGG